MAIIGLIVKFDLLLDDHGSIALLESLPSIAMAPLLSLLKDWLYSGKARSATTMRSFGGAYSVDQTSTTSPVSVYRRTNVDGSPMVGCTDIHGNPYGVSNSNRIYDYD